MENKPNFNQDSKAENIQEPDVLKEIDKAIESNNPERIKAILIKLKDFLKKPIVEIDSALKESAQNIADLFK